MVRIISYFAAVLADILLTLAAMFAMSAPERRGDHASLPDRYILSLRVYFDDFAANFMPLNVRRLTDSQFAADNMVVGYAHARRADF